MNNIMLGKVLIVKNIISSIILYKCLRSCLKCRPLHFVASKLGLHSLHLSQNMSCLKKVDFFVNTVTKGDQLPKFVYG